MTSLEALDRLRLDVSLSHTFSIDYIEANNECDIIKKDLERLEQIDNAKPSEALECVDVLKEDGCITTLYQGKALETIRQTLLKAQEQDKILEIVKGNLYILDEDIHMTRIFANEEANKLIKEWLNNVK